jgi:ferritin-like metal-binding protein YciE
MKNNQKDTLTTWLKDAYAMEEGIVEILERQIDQAEAEDMTEAVAKMREHLAMTKTHADRVRSCLEQLGEDVSHVKSGIANLLGAVHGMTTVMANDRMLKNAMGNFAIEHFEISAYRANAEAARALGYEDIAQVCEEIIQEEQQMADWLEGQLPVVTRHILMTASAEGR